MRDVIDAVLGALDDYEGGRSPQTFNAILGQVKRLRMGAAASPTPTVETIDHAIAAIAGMPRPYPMLAFLSLAGSSVEHIAKTLDMDQALIMQLRAKLAAKLRPMLSAN